jgi:hypothetical protein
MYSDPFFFKLVAWTVKESADYIADSLADAALLKLENE